MNEKIAWYREVLTFEPGSRIFLPLAKMLVQEGEFDEACRVMASGMARNEDFLDARLYYINLLYSLHRMDECRTQIGWLTRPLAAAKGFWKAWAELLDAEGRDSAGLSARLLGASLEGKDISLVTLLNRGLASMENGGAAAQPARPASAQTPAADAPVASVSSRKKAPAASAVQEPARRPLPGSDQFAAAAERLTRAGAIEQPASQDDEEDGDAPAPAPFSLRTRSMAEVLAEQGDYDGALDIYAELLNAASDASERADLQARMDKITAARGPEDGKNAAAAADPARGRSSADENTQKDLLSLIVYPGEEEAAEGAGSRQEEASQGSAASSSEVANLLASLAGSLEARAAK